MTTNAPLPAPDRNHCPPAELRSKALRFDGDALSRRALLALVDAQIEARRSAFEVTASLVLFSATR